MKHIANIVTTYKLDVSEFFNVVKDYNDIDKTVPTLIVGWKEVKKLFPSQDILISYIDDNTTWTFSKREKRFQYEKDIKLFIDNIIKNLNNNVNYKFFNYILYNKKKQETFIEYVKKGNCSLYHNSRFLYIYNHIAKVTLGISLNDLKFININVGKFIKELVNNNNNIICDSLKCFDTQSLSLIKDNIKVLPYLNYLKNLDIY